jgi:hypothetical protein
MKTKTIGFILMMGVLGNLLFAVSNYAGYLSPGVALDFSLVAVFIAGLYGGPVIGFTAGLFVGILPGIVFGPLGMGSWLGLFGLPIGKGLSGLTAGIISRSIRLGQRSHAFVFAIPSTLLAYVPECLFTYGYFAFLMPFFLNSGSAYVFFAFILPKALGEVLIISFLMASLIGNHGFSDFMSRYFMTQHVVLKSGTGQSS